MTLGLLIAAARRIAWMDRELRAGRWSRAQDGMQLAGRTLGLVGFGQIGQRVATAALALGMTVRAFDPLLAGPGPVAGVGLVATLDDLLRQSDVLSLHVPLTAETRGMIGKAQIDRLPPKAILINTARGKVVNEPDLIAALKDGRLFAAGLDTTNDEPIAPDSELLKLDNVVLTPHVGASTPEALEAVALSAASNVLGFLGGKLPDSRWCLNPQVLRA
jgi:D-3-phosphoglycerate dehydrogenase